PVAPWVTTLQDKTKLWQNHAEVHQAADAICSVYTASTASGHCCWSRTIELPKSGHEQLMNNFESAPESMSSKVTPDTPRNRSRHVHGNRGLTVWHGPVYASGNAEILVRQSM